MKKVFGGHKNKRKVFTRQIKQNEKLVKFLEKRSAM